VPPDHADSNYRMAREALLDAAAIPPAHVHRVRTEEVGTPEAAAAAYEQDLVRSFDVTPPQRPRFDVVLLGMGADGHTASIFPQSSACAEEHRLACAVWVERLKAFRITLSPPAINEARAVLFLVTGADKADALRAVLDGERSPERLPARLIAPRAGELAFLVDRAAAAKLPESRYAKK
jgi:6-phosphogluconolactonase